MAPDSCFLSLGKRAVTKCFGILFKLTDVCKESWENQSRVKRNSEAFQHEPRFLKQQWIKEQ